MQVILSFLLLICSMHTTHSAAYQQAAANSSHSSMIQACAQLGALQLHDPNGREEPFNRTKLMRAACAGNKAEVLQAIQQGADPYLKDTNNYTALELAAYFGHSDIAQLLLMFGDKKKMLSHVHPSGDQWSVLSLARKGYADPNVKGQHSELLHFLYDQYDRYVLGNGNPLKKDFMTADVLAILCKLIHEEEVNINVAQYRFTHGDPARAMASAKQRGIASMVVVDKDYHKEYSAALNHLLLHDIPVYYAFKTADNSADYFSMHHKFYLFGHNSIHKRPLLLSGCCNNTGQAYTSNWEDARLIDAPESIQAFHNRFNALVSASIQLTSPVSGAKDHYSENCRPKVKNKIRSIDFS